MLEDLPHVPPAVPLLISEVLFKSGGTFEGFRKRLIALLPELRNQSEWYAYQVPAGVKAVPGQLDIYVDGGLNLFDAEASCRSVDCRAEAAVRLCRSVGLLADTVWLTDHLSEGFIEFGKVSDRKVVEVWADALVLAELNPLVAAGIVRFTPSWMPVCRSCGAELDRQIDQIADHLLAQFEGEFDVIDEGRGIYTLSTGELFDPPMVYASRSRRSRTPEPAESMNDAWQIVRDAVRKAVWISYQAAGGAGTVFSNSRAGIAGLAYKDGGATTQRQLRLLEDSRNINLPWVSELTPEQVVQLRHEAGKALPAFRESLARSLEPSDKPRVESVNGAIASLREQAIEVRGEIENTRRHAGKFWKSAYTVLGFGISAYGIGTENTMAALAGLLPMLNLMITHEAGSEKDIDKLQRKPGYVLVKAQDILAHSHEKS